MKSKLNASKLSQEDKELVKQIKEAVACGKLKYDNGRLVFGSEEISRISLGASNNFNNVQNLESKNFDNSKNESFAHLSVDRIENLNSKKIDDAENVDNFDLVKNYSEEKQPKSSNLCKTFSSYLSPIPNVEKYRDLLLSQKLVRTYLKSDELKQNPKLAEGALSSAFYDYQRKYSKKYLQEMAEFEKEVRKCWKDQKNQQTKIEALSSLDQLPELGKSKSEFLSSMLGEFYALYPKSTLTQTEKEVLLRQSPIIEGFVLGTPSPLPDFQAVCSKIQSSLESKIQRIQDYLMQKIFRESSSTDSQKLIDLIQVSRLEDLTKLLTGKNKNHLLHTIRKLFLDEL